MNPERFTNKTYEILAGAQELAINSCHAQMTLHIAVALISDPNGIFRQSMISAAGNEEAANSVERVFNRALKKLPSQCPPPDQIPVSTTTFQALKTYGRDLVEQAGKLDPVIGRDEEIWRVIRILSSRTKNNPVLIGEPGVGKTAVVEGLAQRIVRRDVFSNLPKVRLIALDMGALVGDGPKVSV